jgi:hypothetical protein
MFTKGRFVAESFTSSYLGTLRARSSRACGLSALAILFLLAACTSGRIAAGRKSDAASAASRAKGNLLATSSPDATSHLSEKMLPAIRQELVVGKYTKAHQDLAMVVEHCGVALRRLPIISLFQASRSSPNPATRDGGVRHGSRRDLFN